MNDTLTLPNTSSWTFFVKLTFGISLAAMAAFIFFLGRQSIDQRLSGVKRPVSGQFHHYAVENAA
jgi:hypothetical protein